MQRPIISIYLKIIIHSLKFTTFQLNKDNNISITLVSMSQDSKAYHYASKKIISILLSVGNHKVIEQDSLTLNLVM